MKIYYHLNPEGFSNTYVIANEKTKDVIIIDPGAMNEEIIEQIEANEFKLTSVLITHNHGSHVNGLKTLLKIYSPRIYGADCPLHDASGTYRRFNDLQDWHGPFYRRLHNRRQNRKHGLKLFKPHP